MEVKKYSNKDLFFALLRAGLWEQSDRLLFSGKESVALLRKSFAEVYKIAQNQTVVGLICSGLAKTVGLSQLRLTDDQYGQLMGELMVIEDRNKRMNEFICDLMGKMSEAGIFALIIKGQGIAQCYEKSLWRSCGDVDLFLDAKNYEKAKKFFIPIASECEPEGKYSKHYGFIVKSWVVELHGTLHCGLTSGIDRCLDDIQRELFEKKMVRVWNNNGVEVSLPCPDDDVIFEFTHISNHFYKGGIGLRQICDWCRLLWTYRDEIDVELLEKRIAKMRLKTIWKAFAAFVVDYLGMPVEAMPMYDSANRWKRKAKKLYRFILAVGNFGQNRDMSYYSKYPYVVRKAMSLGRRVGDVCRHAGVFPVDSIRFLPSIVFHGVRNAARGE